MHNIQPIDISEYITFDRTNKNWQYSVEKRNMSAIQAEGVAGICQRLAKYNIALLADEVGMGKTIQAFGVMTMVWEKKKDARILVFAPRREVAVQWEREYLDFFAMHCKVTELIPNPENKIIVLDRLDEKKGNWLGDAVDFQLVIAKTTSLSYMNIDVEEEKEKAYQQRVSKLNIYMQKYDLLIIDEAQYFRKETGSLRSISAKELFKEIQCPVLLMSATPNHNSNEDIKRIISYFPNKKNIDENIHVKKLMKMIAVRRFRRLSKHGSTKYEYREEKALPSSFSTSKDKIDTNELFFALYQRQLLLSSKEYAKNLEKGQKFWQYLEGTEFDPHQFGILQNTTNDQIKEECKKDYDDDDNVADHFILKELIGAYKSSHNHRSPENPKYLQTRDNLVNKNYIEQEKALVFSRRIPSVKELARGLIKDYDDIMWQMICQALEQSILPILPRNRNHFEDFITAIIKEPDTLYEDKQDEDITNDDNIDWLESKILGYFRREKQGSKEKSTIASRFVRKFDLTETHQGKYCNFFIMDKNESFWNWDSELKELIQELDADEKQALEKLVRKAARYASIGIVELFCCYIKSLKEDRNFYVVVKEKWILFKLKKQIIEITKHFKIFYTKVMGLSREKLKIESWNTFNNALPAYSYMSGTRNESVIQRFNSPFFPDILVSTSVLQEGVNLQFFCDKVVHYGIAWTVGDDEQRIGRIDRMLGLIEHKLNQNLDSKLTIEYPYLCKTHDEQRLCEFLRKKSINQMILDMFPEQETLQNPDNNFNVIDSTPIDLILHKNFNQCRLIEDPYPWDDSATKSEKSIM